MKYLQTYELFFNKRKEVDEIKIQLANQIFEYFKNHQKNDKLLVYTSEGTYLIYSSAHIPTPLTLKIEYVVSGRSLEDDNLTNYHNNILNDILIRLKKKYIS